MILQMFRLIALFGCIFLGSTHTSITQGGEKSDPWRSSPHLSRGQPQLDNNTESQHLTQQVSSLRYTSTTTEPPRTGIEAPPIENYVTISPTHSGLTSQIVPESSSNLETTLSPTVSNSWQFTDSPTTNNSSRLSTEPTTHESTEATPLLNRRSSLSRPSTSLRPSKDTTWFAPSPSTIIPTIALPRSNRPTTGQKRRTSTSSLGTPPPRTTPLSLLLDQDEYYSAYPDYSEPLPSQINNTGKLEGVLVPEPESDNAGRSSWERKQTAPQSRNQHILSETPSYKARSQDRRATWSGIPGLVERRIEEPSSVALEQNILGPLDQTEGDRRLAIELPDDSLADTDLHDHDLIDSVMYIYFGASPSDQRAPGRQVVVVGCVVGLLAQFLTLAGGIRRMRSKPDSSLSVLLHTELALTLTNLVFILGVQARGSYCEGVAVSLHYLHLVVCSWLSASCLHSYRRIVHPNRSNPLLVYAAVSWGLPSIPTLLCYWLEREAYETRDYCWMSVERGMMLSFLLPTSLLILVNTVLALAGLKQAKQDDPERRSLRISASLLPMFSVIWFLGVVALEHSSSLVLPLLFVATSGFLNWFVLICWLPSEAGGWRAADDDLEDEEDDLYDQEVKVVMDEQPLLQEVCLTRPPYHSLHMEPISTISS